MSNEDTGAAPGRTDEAAPHTNGGFAPTRRALFAGAGAVGAGAVLAACGDGTDEPTGPPGDGSTPAATSGSPDEAGPAGDPLAGVDEVDVGGGVINDAAGVVVTQPEAGQFRGFSATCTHEGCTVSEVTDRTIVCRCHGSRFAIDDGAVVQAAPGLTPETQDPLPEVSVVVEGDAIVRA